MYTIIYGRLIGKHFVDHTSKMNFEFTDEQKANLNTIHTDFIAEYKEIFDDDKLEGLCTSSVTFKVKLISYDDLEIGASYFVLTDDQKNVLYFEKLKEIEEIYVVVGEEIHNLYEARSL